MYSFWGTSLLFLVFCETNADLIRKRPENGIGELMISSDDSHEQYNKQRLMVVFDLGCLEDNQVETNQLQQSKVNSIINNHYPCLTQHNSKHFEHTKTGYSLSFLNVNNDGCLSNQNVSLNYDDHCINMITYEPIFYVNFGENYISLTRNDYICNIQHTNATILPSDSAWGLDQLDSFYQNNLYQYPNIDRDNGVDLYIVDSGIRDTHDEFYPGQVIHELGDGYGYYAANDWYASHGTHVAASAGGINYGVSKNLTIYDYAVCVYSEYSEPSSSYSYPCYTNLILSALDKISTKLLNNDRRGVINLSLGGSRSFFSYLFEYYFDEIIENGGIIAVAAGNYDIDACEFSPAWTNTAITVGASDNTMQKAYFSNWGSCVDIWAPGVDIPSAIADCDNCYDVWDGTSMAAPHITGYIANLLWIDPTLTYYQIKNILTSNTSDITGDECDDSYNYTCLFSFFDCNILPINYYPGTLTPTQINLNNTFIGWSQFNNYDCNMISIGIIDPLKSDENEYNNYYVTETYYEPTDRCQTHKFDIDNIVSFSYNCISNNQVNVNVWTSETCDDDDYVTVLTITDGLIDNNYWYHVDCENEYNTQYENDNTDCDVAGRTWYSEDYIVEWDPIVNDNVTQCIYNKTTSTYYDFAYILGTCYIDKFAINGNIFSYKFSCTNNSVTITLYNGDNCNSLNSSYNTTRFEGCYSEDGYYLEIMACGSDAMISTDIPTKSPKISTSNPTKSPTDNPSYNPSDILTTNIPTKLPTIVENDSGTWSNCMPMMSTLVIFFASLVHLFLS